MAELHEHCLDDETKKVARRILTELYHLVAESISQVTDLSEYVDDEFGCDTLYFELFDDLSCDLLVWSVLPSDDGKDSLFTVLALRGLSLSVGRDRWSRVIVSLNDDIGGRDDIHLLDLMRLDFELLDVHLCCSGWMLLKKI